MGRPFRYTFILALVAIGTALAAVGGWRYARASAPVNGPIVLVSIDSLRADHLPIHGYAKVRTPAIDALAADGVVFDRAYAHVPQTLPAHAAILSGRLPFETGVRNDETSVVRRGERLLPQMLRERGYTTGGVVSAYSLRKATGIGQGFDFFDAELPPSSPDVPESLLRRAGIDSEAVAEHWLDTVGTARSFLFLHVNEPHAPYPAQDANTPNAPYDAAVVRADAVVGKLVQYLKAHQLYDRSTILLVSDHGEGLGKHGEQGHGFLLYDEAVHVPLIVKQAAGAGAGRHLLDVVQQIDLVPTVLDMVKAPIPRSLRGRSLKPLLEGSGAVAEQPVYSEAGLGQQVFGWKPAVSLTGGRYRFIVGGREELYDLTKDAHERENIVADLPQAAGTLRLALKRFVADAEPAQTPPASKEAAARLRERLDAMGHTPVDVAQHDPDAPEPGEVAAGIARYETAERAAIEGRWSEALSTLQPIASKGDGTAGAWMRVAIAALRADRPEVALDAARHVIDSDSNDPRPFLVAARALFRSRKLDEAVDHAQFAADLPGADPLVRGEAHELLARLALARHDADAARHEAKAAKAENASLVTPQFVDARLLYDEGKFEDALPIFARAAKDALARGGLQMPELQLDLADCAVHLERYDEAEAAFLEEIEFFPRSVRARAGLATLYHATGRADEAAQVVDEMTRLVPTADSYAQAVRLWTSFGNSRKAAAVRAEARRVLPPSKPAAHQ